tara:strand:- start:1180 stop:1428 length:249 start_codon:yes stop_codon:yes gene_type:complete
MHSFTIYDADEGMQGFGQVCQTVALRDGPYSDDVLFHGNDLLQQLKLRISFLNIPPYVWNGCFNHINTKGINRNGISIKAML